MFFNKTKKKRTGMHPEPESATLLLRADFTGETDVIPDAFDNHAKYIGKLVSVTATSGRTNRSMVLVGTLSRLQIETSATHMTHQGENIECDKTRLHITMNDGSINVLTVHTVPHDPYLTTVKYGDMVFDYISVLIRD